MAGLSSQGLTLGKGDGASPEVFTDIAEITDVSGPTKDNPEIDVTSLSSTAKEFIAGLVDNGEVSLSLLFDPDQTTHDDLLTDLEARSVDNYQITFTDTSPVSTWTFPAFVKSFSISASVDSAITGEATLRVSGTITRA